MEGWPLGINPFLAVRRFPEERQPRYVPPEEDFWAVYNQSAGQDKVMLLTYLHLAARRSEVFHLQWDDVDFLNGRVRLWTRKRTGGHQEYDWLPMTTELKNALLLWRQERLRHTQTTKEYVFVCLDKTAFCEDYYGKPFIHRQHLMEKLCVKAKVKAFGFHGIRHLTASILYQKGYPLSVIQTILRHANPNTTARYIHSLGLEETRDALEEGLKGLGKVIEFHPKVVMHKNTQSVKVRLGVNDPTSEIPAHKLAHKKTPIERASPKVFCVPICVHFGRVVLLRH
jgi:integrase